MLYNTSWIFTLKIKCNRLLRYNEWSSIGKLLSLYLCNVNFVLFLVIGFLFNFFCDLFMNVNNETDTYRKIFCKMLEKEQKFAKKQRNQFFKWNTVFYKFFAWTTDILIIRTKIKKRTFYADWERMLHLFEYRHWSWTLVPTAPSRRRCLLKIKLFFKFSH